MHMEQVTNYEKIKVTSTSEIFKTIQHNGSYLLLLVRKNWKILKFHENNSFSIENNSSSSFKCLPPISPTLKSTEFK